MKWKKGICRHYAAEVIALCLHMSGPLTNLSFSTPFCFSIAVPTIWVHDNCPFKFCEISPYKTKGVAGRNRGGKWCPFQLSLIKTSRIGIKIEVEWPYLAWDQFEEIYYTTTTAIELMKRSIFLFPNTQSGKWWQPAASCHCLHVYRIAVCTNLRLTRVFTNYAIPSHSKRVDYLPRHAQGNNFIKPVS